MMAVFDPVKTINEKADRYLRLNGRKPQTVTVSPRVYRRLLEIRIAGLMEMGHDSISTALETIPTIIGAIRVIIDEKMSDDDVGVA
jgi:hypothetical protein